MFVSPVIATLGLGMRDSRGDVLSCNKWNADTNDLDSYERKLESVQKLQVNASRKVRICHMY